MQTVREAKRNNVPIKNQLGFLWKIELENLLLRNGLPLYAQRERPFIIDKLCSLVPKSKLAPQIADELKSRDLSTFIPADDGQVAGIFKSTLIEALSEENFEEFTLDKWIELYRGAKEVGRKKRIVEQTYIAKRPHTVPYTDIEVSLGAPWISAEIINDFSAYLLHFDSDGFTDWSREHFWESRPQIVKHEPITGNWHINYKHWLGNTVYGTQTYGTPRCNALEIIEASLNLREIKIHDANRKFDEAETLAALDKQKKIIEEFNAWIWKDKNRRYEVEEMYNAIFADIRPVKYNGSKLAFPDQNPSITLYDYQKDAVERILSTKNTLLAFDVGAGKTFIMISAAMEMRRRGISRKNLFVVPNNIVGQWADMFLKLFPKAKILSIEPKTFKPDMRAKVLSQMQNGDYDGIIIAYSCFESIHLSNEYVMNKISSEIKRIQEDLDALKTHTAVDDVPITRLQEYIKTTLGSLITSTATDAVTFDSLEINTIFLDEAHNYKNVPIKTHLKNIRGINPAGSKKCLDMLEKVRCVQAQNGGRGAVFATGTPLCNSISDAYVMQLYLQPERLEKANLLSFDNWVKTFARPEQSFEIDVNISSYRIIRRFTKFFNLPELSLLFSEISGFYFIEKKDLPYFDDYNDVVLKGNENLKNYMAELTRRTEKIRSKDVHPEKDNMLKVTSDGRAAALDLTLVERRQPYDDSSKIMRCVGEVYNIYHSYEGCSQLIFCDLSTPKGTFNVYNELKRRFVDLGIPEKEIAFAHSYHSESSRLKLYENVNNGIVRILIGSTFKLGIGANVQTKLKAVHHLDVPWRPADVVQREGRILRRDNENEQIFIFRYIIEGSFDAYSWQILETKQRFISQFLSGSVSGRTISDLEDSVLTYAEVKALALNEPKMRELSEKENELRNLKILHMKELESRDALKKECTELQEEIEGLEEKYRLSELNGQYVRSIDLAGEKPSLMNFFVALDIARLTKVNEKIGTVGEFQIITPLKQSLQKPFIYLSRLGVSYILELGNSAGGNVRRIVNFFEKFDKTTQNFARLSCEKKEHVKKIQAELSSPLSFPKKIERLSAEVERLFKTIRGELQKGDSP